MKLPNPNSIPPLLTVAEVSDRLQVSIRTVRRLIASEKMKALHIGRLIRVTPAAIEAYLTEVAGE
jgi:excisionase family DNA binding protein